jgi:hypothetical protein
METLNTLIFDLKNILSNIKKIYLNLISNYILYFKIKS